MPDQGSHVSCKTQIVGWKVKTAKKSRKREGEFLPALDVKLLKVLCLQVKAPHRHGGWDVVALQECLSTDIVNASLDEDLPSLHIVCGVGPANQSIECSVP